MNNAKMKPPGHGVMGLTAPKLDVVRWGFIGVGHRGLNMVKETLLLEGCEVVALGDPDEAAVRRTADAVVQAGRPPPACYGSGPEPYRAMLDRSDLDAVMICTSWRARVPAALATLRSGKHAFLEVPAALTIEDCWQLVDTAEATRRHCMMMENCCYGREELMVLNMCRQGLFGELLHGEGSYFHDLRSWLTDDSRGLSKWRTREHTLRDGNLYPTHGLGPIAQYMGINRGDRFDQIVSMSSPSRGLAEYAERHLPPQHPHRLARYVCGDLNTSLIQTVRGRTIVVKHDIVNPVPYSRTNLIVGTRGAFAGDPDRICVEGRGAPEEWDLDMGKWHAEFDHPLWTKCGKLAAGIDRQGGMGHGGMDFVMKWRIVQCLREGLPLDQDVYDAAAWSAIGPLSEQSVARRGAPVEVPDFTRGAWKAMAPLGVVA